MLLIIYADVVRLTLHAHLMLRSSADHTRRRYEHSGNKSATTNMTATYTQFPLSPDKQRVYRQESPVCIAEPGLTQAPAAPTPTLGWVELGCIYIQQSNVLGFCVWLRVSLPSDRQLLPSSADLRTCDAADPSRTSNTAI